MTGETITFMYVLAQIAGVFIGFGALISASKSAASMRQERELLAAIVWIGIMLLVGAILPILLDRYGLSITWSLQIGAVVLLLMAWIGIIRFWAGIVHSIKSASAYSALFLVQETAVQLPLVLILFGLYSQYHEAFYLTALVVSAFEAAQNLVNLVLARPTGDED